jgi:nucleoside 2-deoxyribosyltransferase
MKIYLAGPEVFRPDCIAHGRYLKQCCADHGHRGFFPLDNEEDHPEEIDRANLAMIDLADVVVANLSPFRGPSADAGTILEVGYARARDKTVIGWTRSPTKYLERVQEFHRCWNLSELGHYVDVDGMMIEDFQGFDNLMISYSVHAIFNSFEEAIERVTDVVSARFTLAGKFD